MWKRIICRKVHHSFMRSKWSSPSLQVCPHLTSRCYPLFGWWRILRYTSHTNVLMFNSLESWAQGLFSCLCTPFFSVSLWRCHRGLSHGGQGTCLWFIRREAGAVSRTHRAGSEQAPSPTTSLGFMVLWLPQSSWTWFVNSNNSFQGNVNGADVNPASCCIYPNCVLV